MSVKRLFDVVFAGAALCASAPLMLFIAAVVTIDSPGPALFVQARVGRSGRTFRMLKFRSMYLAACHGQGSALTAASDPRVTRIGRWLRATHLDELPQLINILLGDMSVVGPRPEHPRFVAHYDDAARRVFAFRPGLTDPATLRFHDEARALAEYDDPESGYLREIMPRKVALSLEYAERATLLSDLRVIWDTLRAIVVANRQR